MTSANPTGGFRITGRLVLAITVLFFVVIAAVNALMATLAIRTFGGVDAENAYREGITFARELRAAEAQNALGWEVDVTVSPLVARGLPIEVTIRDRDGNIVPAAEVTVVFQHPTFRRYDASVKLEHAGVGMYRGIAPVGPGKWNLLTDIHRGGERVFRSRNLVVVK